jgi:alkylhydroperoxidase family enzyme
MPRLPGVSSRDAGLSTKIAYYFMKRHFKKVTGHENEAMLAPVQILAHIPTLLSGYGKLEQAVAKVHLLDLRHRALAELKAATIVRCEYCIDLGSDYSAAMSRTPVEVSDELFDALRKHFDVPQLVELTHVIALENLRGRFNLALDIGSAGFSEGMVCAIPA